MTRYSRDNQRPDTETRAGELDIDSYSMTLCKTMSLNAALERLLIYVPGLTVIDSSVHIILRLMFVKVKLATVILGRCEENNTLVLGLHTF